MLKLSGVSLFLIIIVVACGLFGTDDIVIFSCHEDVRFIEPDDQCLFNTSMDGYVGIWYGQTPLESGYKYAGGLGTYTSHHAPLAVYAEEVHKTFFTYGGTHRKYDFNRSYTTAPDQLYIMVSYFDHNTGQLAIPTLVFDKWTNDPHDNPVIEIDQEGFIWLFAPSHGEMTTPSYILKSVEPYSTREFEVIEKSLFAYPQPHINSRGNGLFFYTSYEYGRTLKYRKFKDGQLSPESKLFSIIDAGHYQVSASNEEKIVTAMNFHPRPGGSDYRTNLYYLESSDFGESWNTISGQSVTLPVRDTQSESLVKEYKEEGLLTYIMDITLDDDQNPVILYNVASTYKPGLENQNRKLKVAFYREDSWHFVGITNTDNNYNMGTIIIDKEGRWNIIAPTDVGPQRYSAGGELVMWASEDKGYTWHQSKKLTENSSMNHNYVRRVQNGNDEFSFFWSDGHGYKPSASRFFYSDISGHVMKMPYE